MINFFKKKTEKKTEENINKKLVLVCSLFIHAAKMDQNYSENEKNIILKAMRDLYPNKGEKFDQILLDAEKKEKESNQILEFTREIKLYDKVFRLKVVEILWKIIYSDGISDMYESNLMRRLGKLLYISDKEIGEIKINIKK
tara:strand:+ start:1364 stop:1789 length:426 start_codon:yes stop_codon:yes gene_type:complete